MFGMGLGGMLAGVLVGDWRSYILTPIIVQSGKAVLVALHCRRMGRPDSRQGSRACAGSLATRPHSTGRTHCNKWNDAAGPRACATGFEAHPGANFLSPWRCACRRVRAFLARDVARALMQSMQQGLGMPRLIDKSMFGFGRAVEQ